MQITQPHARRQAHPSVQGRLVFVGLMLAAVTALHYLTSAHLLPYHSIYRSLYYLPIGVAAVTWGFRGGIVAALVTTAAYLPHVFLMGNTMPGGVLENVLEVLAFNAVAALTGALSDAQRHQRQRAEALRAYIDDVLAGLPVGVATTGLDETLSAQNPAATELLGNLADPQRLPTALGYTELEIGGRPIGVRRSLLHGVDGTATGQVVVLEDLSEQRRLHEQVRRTERLAALGQLAGGVAHEIRNPLAIMRAVAQLLSAKLGDRADLHRHMEVLTVEADRIDRLIGELLTYGSAQPPQMDVFEAGPMLKELATSLAPYADQRGVTIHVEVRAALQPLRADREHLRQALLNLLLNAVQASGSGQAVELWCNAEAEGMVFKVRDHGAGIPAEIHGRMFDPFFTTRDEGTGMGLAVVSRITAEHGGTVDVRDAPGGGTVATLCVPANMGAT